MSYIIKIISSFFLIFVVVFCFGQDIHFSQYYNSPLSLNPALAGNHQAEWRLSDIYRTQWFTVKYPFHSHFISIDKQIFVRKAKFNAALILANDVSGDAVLSTSKYYFNLSWHPKIKAQHFSFGIQIGYVTKNFNPEKLTFPDQYDNLSGYYDINLPHPDATIPLKQNYPDVNAGFSWNTKFNKLFAEAGFSLFHLNMPAESFMSGQNNLKMRKAVYSRLIFPVSASWNMSPTAYFTEINKASEFISGLSFFKKINNNNSLLRQIEMGIYNRSGFKRNFDAIIITTNLAYRKINTGIAYDLNISGLHKYSSYQGAIEFFIIYSLFHKAHEKYMIPCERL